MNSVASCVTATVAPDFIHILTRYYIVSHPRGPQAVDHTLELLLDYDGRIEVLPGGFHLRFVIRRVPLSAARPHGLMYSFTLHDSDNARVLGFDNAHAAPRRGRAGGSPHAYDHWHRTRTDPGRPYAYRTAADLLHDFFREVSRVMLENGFDLDHGRESQTDEEPFG